MRASGRARLPTCVVRMRWVLCCMLLSSACETLHLWRRLRCLHQPLLPEPRAREPGALGQHLELGPRDGWRDARPIGAGTKAAIRTGNDVLAAHDAGTVHDAVRHQLWMLNAVGLRINDAR